MTIDNISNILKTGPNATYFQNNPEALNRSTDAVQSFPSFMHKTVAGLNLNFLQYILSLSIGSAISQSAQEFNTQLAPKATVAFLKNIGSAYTDPDTKKTINEKLGENLKMAVINSFDEMTVEILEYIALYFLSTFFSAANAQVISKTLKLPHFELIGQRLYDLKQKIGKEQYFGTVKPHKFTLTENIYKKVAMGKTLNFMATGLVAMCFEVALTSLRPLITEKLFGVSNFYSLSGMHAEKSDDEKAAMHQAKLNFQYFMTAIPLIIGGFFGLTHLLKNTKIHQKKFFEGFSKRFDFGNKFDLSRSALIFPLMVGATIGYDLTSRNIAEIKENIFRMFFQSWLSIIFFKQSVGTLLTWLAGLYYTKGHNIIENPFTTWYKEVLGKESGKRDPFDMLYGEIKKEANGTYSGVITQNKHVKNLDAKTQENMFKRIHHFQKIAPQWYFAFPFGLGVAALINYPRTLRLNQEEKEGKHHADNVQHNFIYEKMEGFVDWFAHYLYNIQQTNYKNYLQSQNSLTSSLNLTLNPSIITA